MTRFLRSVAIAAILATMPLAATQTAAYAQSGIASEYGSGRATASGEPFNPHALTAAHRSLPFGTRVRVTNLRNGRAVVVKITDRGPFVAGRIIDLTPAAAAVIGLDGLAHVTVTVI